MSYLQLWGLLLTFLCLLKHQEAVDFKAAREGHRPIRLTDQQLSTIAELSNETKFRPLLDPIMVPRVVGTEGHQAVKEYLVEKMQSLGWEVEQDTFTTKTPIGRLEFSNVVARLNPNAQRFLTLACHYDSKLMREGSFIGATDSAVPCAMMLDLATALQGPLQQSKSKDDVSLKFIFFDGEEAFNQWGPNDSIYGSKHLARKLESTPYPANSRTTNHLSRMDILVLLDLIGAPDPTFYSYFRNTERWYYQLVEAEKRLAQLRLLGKYSIGVNGYPSHKYFQERSTAAGIEDDHLPFMRKGVPILHLIPMPFPDVWHTERDNMAALDFSTIDNLNKIMRVFVASYLKLNI